MQNYGYESPRLELWFLVEDVVRTSENLMPDPYNFRAGEGGSPFESFRFGQ